MRAAWVGLVVALLLGCSERDERARGRVLLVGLDGATLRVIRPLLEKGRLPNLARIAAEGVHGPLQSFPPLYSPPIWTTIATGKAPEKHGVLGFTQPRPDGSSALYLSSDRKGHALWNITSDAGLTTGVIHWWTTFPPERIRGVMVSDHLLEGAVRRSFFAAAEGPAAPVVFPESWEARARALANDPGTLAELPNPLLPLRELPATAPLRPQLDLFFATDLGAMSLALAAEEEFRPDVLLVFLSGIDHMSHFLWGALEPPERYSEAARLSGRERAAQRDALLGYYTHTDRLLAPLLDRYGPDDLVLVVSDHGMEAVESVSNPNEGPPTRLTGGHESPAASRGILFARGPGIVRGAPVRGTTVRDVTPTILAWLGLPLGADMDGKPAAFLDRRPPPSIATHDTRPVERVPTDSRGAERERLEQLRGLGYIE